MNHDAISLLAKDDQVALEYITFLSCGEKNIFSSK